MSSTNVDIKINKSEKDASVVKNDTNTQLCNTSPKSPNEEVIDTEEESKKMEHAKKAYAMGKHTSKYKRYYVNTRYDRLRILLINPNEIDTQFFKRTFKSIRAHSMGCLWGLLDGALSGWLIGVKFGGHGGWIVGGISQIASMVLAMSVGLIHGAINGLFTNKEEASLLIRDHRYSIGSTQGDEMIKPGIDIFPSYNIPKYISKGDKKNILYY